MRPQTLTLLLVFLTLQGAEDVLIASWMPQGCQEDSAREDCLPLAVGYRQPVDEQIRPVMPPPSLYQPLGPALATSPHPEQERAEPVLLPAGLLYTLMSLQL
jgi:hypothetical protein